VWQATAIASTAGTLFVRSYERGERVHLAMMSRGYAGSMPAIADDRPACWGRCLAPGLAALTIALSALVMR
jgi:cobalt/nickel transport system permease protein